MEPNGAKWSQLEPNGANPNSCPLRLHSMSLEGRLNLLEKVVGDPETPLLEQVHDLETRINGLLAETKSHNLDFTRLAALLPSGPATGTPPLSREAKTHIIEARAAEVLAQTNGICYELRVPEIEMVDLELVKGEIEGLIHEFDETSQRSIHAARIYLDTLNSVPTSSPQ